MSNSVVRNLSISIGIVQWDDFRGSVLGILYLYLWYSHTISVSNDCVWGSRFSGVVNLFWYWFQSHVSLFVGMDIRCLPELS